MRWMKYTKEDSSLQQLGDIWTHADARISNAEELVDETASSNEDDANEPSTEGACWSGGIIVVFDDSAYFNVWRVLHQTVTEGSLRI